MEGNEEEEEGSQPTAALPQQDASPCQPRAGVMAILFGFRSAGEENPAGRGQVHGGG